MPAVNQETKRLLTVPVYDRTPVILRSRADDKVAALLTKEPLYFVLEFHFMSGGAVKVGDMMTVPAEVEFCGNIIPVKSEPILLKGDGENPYILVI